MTIVDKAINLLKDGAKKVEFEWQGAEVTAYVTAYWVNKILRIDVKGLKED